MATEQSQLLNIRQSPHMNSLCRMLTGIVPLECISLWSSTFKNGSKNLNFFLCKINIKLKENLKFTKIISGLMYFHEIFQKKLGREFIIE